MKRIIAFLYMLLCITVVALAQCPVGGNDNPPPPPPHPQDPIDDTSTSGGISADPNEIIGPTGYDDSLRWVSINDVLNYTIFFENDPDFATANAQKVDVRFYFADKAAMKGFGLGTYGFANQSWNIEDAPAAYQNRLDLRDSMHIFVDLTAGIDVVKQQAFWLFNSIDPETGYNPWQVDRGMLPVNDSTHVGEGFVTFRLKPQEDLKTGDTISIQANIVFDQNDTIPTNRWRNTIDAGNPTSKVKARQDSKNEHLYHLTLQAADDEGGSGLKRVLLYQANNFGIYEEVATCPVDTVIDFTAEPGHQYRFYSIAEDNVGNREPLKEQPDLVININAAPTDIALSDSIFQDDIKAEGFIAELTSEDIDGSTFTYAFAEGEGAVHNDLFQITGSQLQSKNTFKCAEDSVFHVRLQTTDEGGLSFSKPFNLTLKNVLEKPKPDTLSVSICEGDIYNFHGYEYEKAGTYYYRVDNEFMCDSVYVLQLSVLPHLEAPLVTIEDEYTLVSSVAKGNQWFTSDGNRVKGATEQKFTPEEDGIYYVCASNGSCFSEPSNAYRVQLSDHIDLSMDLADGWNWVSSNLSDQTYRKATDFVKPIADKVERLVGFNSELVRDPNLGLVGNLDNIVPSESYLLQTNQMVENTWSGTAYKPENTSIDLKKGWNWIGYVPVSENTLSKSMGDFTPVEGDVIKSYYSFATFSSGKWVGTLESMSPGLGYMYYSNQNTEFKYPAIRVFEVLDEPSYAKALYASEIVPWHMDMNKYPYNMTMIANVYASESLAPAGYFTIGAFVGNECRGIGQYVDDKLFMTIYGDMDMSEKVSFKAFDNVTMEERDVVETTQFGNAMLGSVSSPYRLSVKGAITGIGNTELNNKYRIYPNPVRSTLYVNGDASRIKSVSVIASSGVIVVNAENYQEGGLNVSNLVPGSYIAVINTLDGTVVQKIIKAY